MMCFVMGRWLRFVKSNFQQRPTDGAAEQIALLLG